MMDAEELAEELALAEDAEEFRRFDLVVRVNPWKGDKPAPLDEAIGGVVWSVEVNGQRIAGVPEDAYLALDPFPTLYLKEVLPAGWAALNADPGDLIPTADELAGWTGIPITKVEFVMEAERDLHDHSA